MGSKPDSSNYRPISLLPLLTKVFKRTVLDHTNEILAINKILYDWQSGSWKNYSTVTCLSFLNDKISRGFDDGLLTGMILTELQKAFDTINTSYFLKKLIVIGFSSDTIKSFHSFLLNPFTSVYNWIKWLHTSKRAWKNKFAACWKKI